MLKLDVKMIQLLLTQNRRQKINEKEKKKLENIDATLLFYCDCERKERRKRPRVFLGSLFVPR